MTEQALSAQSTRLSVQQREVLRALREQSPTPTVILYDVTFRRGDMWPEPCGVDPNIRIRIGGPVGAVLRRLEKRGLVTGERGSTCKDWWITDAGLAALEDSDA